MFLNASGFVEDVASTSSIDKFLSKQIPATERSNEINSCLGRAGPSSLETEMLPVEGESDGRHHACPADSKGVSLVPPAELDLAASAAWDRSGAAGLAPDPSACPAPPPSVRYQRVTLEEIDESVLRELPEDVRMVRKVHCFFLYLRSM